MHRGVFVVLLLLAAGGAMASDHADPVVLVDPNANITGLFFFPKGDQMIAILNVRRALTAPPPYELSPYQYHIYMDLHSKVSLDNVGDVARYGGTVMNPSGISPDVEIMLRLNDDTTLKEKKFTGLKNTDSIRVWTGVRDDPFIFPKFFKKNVISMVLSIPMSCFPAGQQDFLLWGVSTKGTEPSDHVGRSNRTQLGRYASLGKTKFVNDLPPKDHVPAILNRMKQTEDIKKCLMKYKEGLMAYPVFELVFQMRSYDPAPDVMIYTTRRPPGFPNGRRLEDDVAHITCEIGDCVLQELSFIEGPYPRATKNDKDFLPDFPYLAEPWPYAPEPPVSMKSIIPLVVFWGVAIFLLILIIGITIGYLVGLRKGRRRVEA